MYDNRKTGKIGARDSDPYGKNKNTVEFESLVFLSRICTVNLSIFYELCRGK